MAKSATTTMTTTTVTSMLTRAVEIGDRLRAIHDDAGLHKLSIDAWRRLSLELGGFKDRSALADARAKLAPFPYLAREIALRGEVFWRNGQDRPALWAGFNDGDGAMAAVYAERLHAGLTVEQCSALASWHVTKLAPSEHFGRLSDFAELEGMVRPLHQELSELDAAISASLLVRDLQWQGARAYVPTSRGLVGVDDTSHARLASATAELAAAGLRLAA